MGILLPILKITCIAAGALFSAALLLLGAALFCAVRWTLSARCEGGLTAAYRVNFLCVSYEGVFGREGGAAASIFGIKLPGKGKKTNGGRKPEKAGSENRRRKAGKNEDGAESDRKKKPEKSGAGGKAKRPLRERLKEASAAAGSAAKTPEIAACAFDALKKLVKAVKVTKLKAEGRLGFEDPSVTGLAVGAIGALAAAAGWDAAVSGNFSGRRAEGEVCAEGRLRLYAVVFPLAAFALKKPVRNVLFSGKRRRKGVKR